MKRLVVTILVVLGLASPALAAPPVQIVEKKGMTAWLVKDDTLPLLTIKMAWRGGTAGDPADKPGLTMLLARLMNEGAGELPALAFQKAMADNVVSLGFDTNRDYLTGTLRCLNDYRHMCLELLRLAVSEPRFDMEAIERMKQEQRTAILRQSQSPRSLANNRLMQLAFGAHPYGQPKNGSNESLEAITRQDLLDHYRAIFARDGMMLAVVGDIDRSRLRRLMGDVFGRLPSTSNITAPADISVRKGPRSAHIERPGPQTSIVFAQQGVAYNHPDFFADFVMNNILGGSGFSSRLTEQVREARGLAYSVFSGTSNFDHAAMWNGSVASDNKTAQQAMDVIRAEMRRMAEEGVSQERLDAAKTYLTGAYALRFDSGSKIAGQLLGIQMNGWPPGYFATRNDKINAITTDDIKRAAQRLDADTLLVVSVGGTAIRLD